jgi:hypothetical protein
LAKLNILAAPCRLKAPNVLLRGSSKEKELIEVTVTRQLCFAGGQIHVLGQLTGRKRPQRNDRHAGFGRQTFQRIRRCRLLFGDWQASEAAEADGG